jgi:hypothetical protein
LILTIVSLVGLRVVPPQNPGCNEASNRSEKENPHSISIVIDIESPERCFVQSVGKVPHKANDKALARAHSSQHGEKDDIHGDGASYGLGKGEVQHITVVGATRSMQYSRKSNIQRIISEGHCVYWICEVDGVPEFFDKEVPLDGEGEHDEVEDEATDGELFKVY